MAERYFKKADGTVIEVQPQHDIESLKDRFTECDANGKELKKEKPKAKKPSKNKGDK
tara:strand:- start:286 stop:456 length:171 start_codon:yes stop_codon:yes gene_type:complete